MRNAPEGGPRSRPLRLFLAALAIVLLILALLAFRTLVLAALVGLMFGVLPEPLIRSLRDRWKFPHALSVLLIVMLLLGALAAGGYGVYRTLLPEVRRLTEQAPAIWEKLIEQVEPIAAQVAGAGLNLQELDLAGMAQGAAQMVLRGITVGVGGLAGVLVVAMIAIFVAANFEGYARGAQTLFPPHARDRARTLAGGAVGVLRRWFVGQMGVAALSGVMTAIAMLTLGVDYWLLISALTVVLGFIPYLGAIITGGVAVVLTLGTEPDKVWWVLLAFVCIQQIESEIVLPLVMKGTIRLPEAHLLVFVVIMGSAFGLLGVFVAPPLFAVLHHLYSHAYVPWIERRRPPEEEGARRPVAPVAYDERPADLVVGRDVS